MEFRKERFGKRSDRYPRNDRTQKGQRGSRTSGSRYGRDSGEGSRYGRDSGEGSRYGRDSSEGSRYGGGSSFRRESDEGTRMQRTNVVCADCGNDCVIPFKPKDSRPVYCRDCFQDHKPQERSDSRFNRTDRGSRYERDSDRGSRFDRNSDSDSRYGQNTRSRFEKDRTPIHSRDSFRKNRFNKPNDFVNQKRKNKYNSDDSDLFYSTLRTKLFKILGGKRCSNCGFEDERALGFGHVDDEESFDYGQRGGSVSSWEKYISEPELARKSLHILCFNCNQINQK